jgi:integrase
MHYREECGECVTKDSWVMRNLWDATKPREKDVITKPRKLTSIGIKRLVERALWAQGVRNKLQEGKKRHEFQTDHGFRKWFRTRCELAGMKLSNIETLMNHSLGISDPIIVSQKANFLRIIREQKISYLLTTSKNYRKRLQT